MLMTLTSENLVDGPSGDTQRETRERDTKLRFSLSVISYVYVIATRMTTRVTMNAGMFRSEESLFR